MKRKTIILLSSVLAGSLLVGGAFAAYAVTDNANPIGVDVKTQAPDQDTPVTLTWGAKEHANIPDLDSGKYAKAGYFTVKSDIEYKGLFSVKMEDKTPQAIIDAKGTESPVFLFDNLEVFIYSGNVVLTDGELPAPLPDGVELVGSISTNQAAIDGVKTWSTIVESDLDGKVFSVLVKSEATEEVLGQLSQDVVRLTIDWGMGAESYEVLAPGYYLVGINDDWDIKAGYNLKYTVVPHEQSEDETYYMIENVQMAKNETFKVKYDGDGVAPEDVKWYGDEGKNIVAPVEGEYTVLFTPNAREDWNTGATSGNMYGVDGHFWIIPPAGEEPAATSKYALYDVTNEKVFVDLIDMEETDPQGRDQASALGVSFKAGDKIKLYDKDNKAGWLCAIEEGSFGSAVASYIQVNTDDWQVLQDFTADVYAKFATNNDSIYFGLK